MAHLSCPQERGKEHEVMIQEPVVSASIHCVVEECVSHPSTHPATVHYAKISGMVLDFLHVSVSFSKNRVHKDSTPFGLTKEFLADLCTMRIHSETCRRTSATKPTVRESLPPRVRCLIWNSGCTAHSPILRPRRSERSTSSSVCCCVPSTSRS